MAFWLSMNSGVGKNALSCYFGGPRKVIYLLVLVSSSVQGRES